MNIAIYTLTSELHDEQAVSAVTREFPDSLDVTYEFKGNDYSDGRYRRHLQTPAFQIAGEVSTSLLPAHLWQEQLSGGIYGNPVIPAAERPEGRDHSRTS